MLSHSTNQHLLTYYTQTTRTPSFVGLHNSEMWKELQGNVRAQSEGIPVEAVEKPAEKKPPSYTVGCSDDFSSPSSNPLKCNWSYRSPAEPYSITREIFDTCDNIQIIALKIYQRSMIILTQF